MPSQVHCHHNNQNMARLQPRSLSPSKVPKIPTRPDSKWLGLQRVQLGGSLQPTATSKAPPAPGECQLSRGVAKGSPHFPIVFSPPVSLVLPPLVLA